MKRDANYSYIWQKRLLTTKDYAFKRATLKNKINSYISLSGMWSIGLVTRLNVVFGRKCFKHARGLRFLRHNGLFGEYFQMLKKFDATSNLATIHSFYYLNFLSKYNLFSKTKLNVLEIGAGGVYLLYFFLRNTRLVITSS